MYDTPDRFIGTLRKYCIPLPFRVHYEQDTGSIANQ